jgi:hypothetical protein
MLSGGSSGRRVLAAWTLAALFVGAAFTASIQHHIAPQSDLWDYSQEARQLARGEGFTSLYTYPVLLRPGEEPPFPVRWRLPLYAAIGAGLLRLGIPLPAGFLWLGVLIHALLIALTFLLAWRLSGRVAAGSIAAACMLICPLLLDPYDPGMSQTLAAALGIGVWLLLLGEGGARRALIAALVAAAAWYLRGESLLFVPLWLWAAGTGRRRVAFGLTYAVLCAAWLIALRAGSGSAAPIGGNPMLLYTPQYPGYSSSRSFATPMPGPLEFVLAHVGWFALRYVRDFAGFIVDFLAGLGPVVVGLLLAAALVRRFAVVGAGAAAPGAPAAPASATDAAYRAALPLALAIPLQILAFSALERSPRFLVPVIPIACVWVGWLAGPVLAARFTRRFLLLLVGVLLLERGATLAFRRAEAIRREPPIPGALAASLEPRAAAWPRGALTLTDVPDWVAWRFDRPALLLPLMRDLPRVTREQRVAAILLSPRARVRNEADRDAGWLSTLERAAPIPGYRGPEALPGGARLYVREPRGSTRPNGPNATDAAGSPAAPTIPAAP